MYLRGSDNSKEPRQSGLMLAATILNKIFMCIISNESAAVENQVDFSRNEKISVRERVRGAENFRVTISTRPFPSMARTTSTRLTTQVARR